MQPNNADRIANSIDPEQFDLSLHCLFPLGAGWNESTLFVPYRSSLIRVYTVFPSRSSLIWVYTVFSL